MKNQLCGHFNGCEMTCECSKCADFFPVEACNVKPLPEVICGDDLFQTQNVVIRRVNKMVHMWKEIMCENYKTLHELEKAAKSNSVYYSPTEVVTQEKYDAESNSVYTVVRIPHKDCRKQPIHIKLRPAYNDKATYTLKEDIFNGSLDELADKMTPAVGVSNNEYVGRFGHNIIGGTVTPSEIANPLYSYGFTASGTLKWFSNATSIEELQRQCVQDSTGAFGILVISREVTDEIYREKIPNYLTTMARSAVGQNYEAKETFFVSVGDYENGGMTSQRLAEIMVELGCDVAVETAQGNSAMVTDKGMLAFNPSNTASGELPEAYAYWYISRKPSYRTEHQFEVAQLMQESNQQLWKNKLAENAIGELYRTVDEHGEGLETLSEKLEQEIADRGADVDTLTSKLDTEIAERTEAQTAIVEAINYESQQRVTGDEAAQSQINILTEKVLATESDIESIKVAIEKLDNTVIDNYDELNSRVSVLEECCQSAKTDIENIKLRLADHDGDISTLQTRMGLIENQMSALDATVASFAQTIANTEIAVNEVKQSQVDLQTRTATLESDVSELQGFAEDIPTIKQDISAIKDKDYAQDNSILEIMGNTHTNAAAITALDGRVETVETAIEAHTVALGEEVTAREEGDEALQAQIDEFKEGWTTIFSRVDTLRGNDVYGNPGTVIVSTIIYADKTLHSLQTEISITPSSKFRIVSPISVELPVMLLDLLSNERVVGQTSVGAMATGYSTDSPEYMVVSSLPIHLTYTTPSSTNVPQLLVSITPDNFTSSPPRVLGVSHSLVHTMRYSTLAE